MEEGESNKNQAGDESRTTPPEGVPIEAVDCVRTQDGVQTRGMATLVVKEPQVRPPRPRFEYGLMPRITKGAIAVNCLCYVLHPDHADIIVAEGRAGGSWKSPSSKFGSMCAEGEQMVQIHKIIKPNVPLIFIEERQPFTLLEHAVVKPAGSSVYVKWHSKLLRKKPTTKPPKSGV
ncbi:hypothetical protein M758_UG254900 [Ceratodon purpureus]|nr:hypothetical protein M758_UG254900 [Ceratodon purpureus]